MFGAFILLALGLGAAADQDIYTAGDGALAAGWENWSWSSDIDFASTSGPGGVEAISVSSQAYAALSLYDETAFDNNYAGLKFDISGSEPDISLYISSSTSNDQTANFALSAMNAFVSADNFTTVIVDFSNLPGNAGALSQDSCRLIVSSHIILREC